MYFNIVTTSMPWDNSYLQAFSRVLVFRYSFSWMSRRHRYFRSSPLYSFYTKTQKSLLIHIKTQYTLLLQYRSGYASSSANVKKSNTRSSLYYTSNVQRSPVQNVACMGGLDKLIYFAHKWLFWTKRRSVASLASSSVWPTA